MSVLLEVLCKMGRSQPDRRAWNMNLYRVYMLVSSWEGKELAKVALNTRASSEYAELAVEEFTNKSNTKSNLDALESAMRNWWSAYDPLITYGKELIS